MIDQLSVQCEDVAASAAFYHAVLAPVGGRRVMDFGAAFVRDSDGNNVDAVCHRP